MREVFQRHLRSLGGKVYQIRECQISHRHRQAHRCMLQYTLRLEEPGTGRERSQWVTGEMYTEDQTRQVWKKLWRAELGRRISDVLSAFEPFSYIPDLEMLVQVFPYDRRLPALPLLMAGPPPELEPLLLARFGPGDWRLEAWDAEPVKYAVEAKATLRLTARARDAATGRAEERRFYAKVYREEEKGKQTHQVLRALWDEAGARGEGFTVGRPIAYLSGLRTLVQEEVPGTSLRDVLHRGDEASPTMRKVARALAALHLGHVATPRRRLLREEVADLERKGEHLRRACPHLGPEIEEAVGAVVAGLEEVPPAPTHRDLFPQHIMLDGDRLVLLDLDDFAEADPLLDVARLLSPFAEARRSSDERAWTIAQAFAEEYFAHVPEAWRTRFPLHYAGAVLRLSFDLLWFQQPDWPDRIEALVEEAKNSLAGKVW